MWLLSCFLVYFHLLYKKLGDLYDCTNDQKRFWLGT